VDHFMNRRRNFRTQLREKALMVGIFYKSAGYQGIEVLGDTGLDCVVIDAEHAPFSASQMDTCLLAAGAADLAALVRVPDDHPQTFQAVLDMGAAGVLAPHVDSAEKARGIVARTHYAGGSRGFSNSPRAGGYGQTEMLAHIVASDREVAVLCQIEDRQAVEAIDEIAAVDGVDCLFIGRADLAVSYGCNDVADPAIHAAVVRVAAAGQKTGVPVGIFLGDMREIQRYQDLGITFFLIGSDQSVLKTAVKDMVGNFRQRSE
jgi:2-keto-3-deoxy-L-rhamnonate aldolase RhmA